MPFPSTVTSLYDALEDRIAHDGLTRSTMRGCLAETPSIQSCHGLLLPLYAAYYDTYGDAMLGRDLEALIGAVKTVLAEDVGIDPATVEALSGIDADATIFYDGYLVSTFASDDQDEGRSYDCAYWGLSPETGKLEFIDDPYWTQTYTMADAIDKCLGGSGRQAPDLRRIDIVSRDGYGGGWGLAELCEQIGTEVPELEARCRLSMVRDAVLHGKHMAWDEGDPAKQKEALTIASWSGELLAGNIYERYRRLHDDGYADLIERNAAFSDVCAALRDGTPISQVLGTEESCVRETVFIEIANILDARLDDVHALWLRNAPRGTYLPYEDLTDAERRRCDSANPETRRLAALDGLGSDNLACDGDMLVRAAIAGKGLFLSRLVYDDTTTVHSAVARNGYGLDKLLTDRDYLVRDIAEEWLKDHGMTLAEWAAQFPDRLALPENIMNARGLEWVAQMQPDDPTMEVWAADVGSEDLQLWIVNDNERAETIVRIEDYRDEWPIIGPEIPIGYIGTEGPSSADEARAAAVMQSYLAGRLLPIKVHFPEDGHEFDAHLFGREIVFSATTAHEIAEHLRSNLTFFPERPSFDGERFEMIDGTIVAEAYHAIPALADKGRYFAIGALSDWTWEIEGIDVPRLEAERYIGLAGEIADAVFDTYELMDQAEVWQTIGEKEAEAVEETAIQLETPSGREFLVSALAAAHDDDAIEDPEYESLIDRIYDIGPVSGFPIEKRVETHGFSSTDYIATLPMATQERLRGAFEEVLAMTYGEPELSAFTEDAMCSRISDISFMDAVRFVERIGVDAPSLSHERSERETAVQTASESAAIRKDPVPAIRRTRK